jgi:hypothetical protein
MKKTCMLILLGLLLNSCGYYCYVSSIGSAPQSKSYCILPNNSNLVGDLEFKQYANMLATALNRVGYENVPQEQAEMIIYFDWKIGNMTTEKVVIQNNYNTTYSPIPTKMVTITLGENPQTTTTTGFTSSQTTYTSYDNEYAPVEVNVVAVDKKTNQQIWKTTIHDDLEYDKTTLNKLMPVMLYAGSKYFGEAADGRVDLSQSEIQKNDIIWPY